MLTGKTIGKYEILGELRREPIFIEYAARDQQTGRAVALRIIPPNIPGRAELLRRFQREARACAALQHPNIIATYEFGEDHDIHFLALELLEGSDLAQIVERQKKEGVENPQSAAVLLGCIVQICRALDYLHRQGIVHRDVKPASIFVTNDGTSKLTQFAASYLPETPDAPGILLGTVEYMSPEQIKARKVDGRSDIWSVGCTIHEILTHRKPFTGETFSAKMFAITTEDPMSINDLRPDLPREVDDVVRRALRKDREERYQNMAELLTDLEPLVKRMQSAAAKP